MMSYSKPLSHSTTQVPQQLAPPRQSAAALQQPQPCSKRRFSALLDEADDSPSKRVCHNRISHWLETLPGPRRCKSSAGYQRPTHSYARSRSAPPMSPSKRRLPPTPSSHSFQSDYVHSYAESTSSKTSTSTKVDDPHYRNSNLGGNRVHLLSHEKPLPPNLIPLMDKIYAERASPPPDRLGYDSELAALEYGKAESDVEDYFKGRIFPKTRGNAVRSDRKMFYKHAVPRHTPSTHRISQPVPDLAYGYTRQAFDESQQTQLGNMGRDVIANAEDLFYPFFLVEMKADGPHGGGGGLYVATNQCLGGSASCVQLYHKLFALLSSCQDPAVRPYDAAFSIAMHGTEARLFVSWKADDYKFYMQRTNIYLLQRAEDFIQFRQHVLNILDWGSTERLDAISTALRQILDSQCEEASKQAKGRLAPSSEEQPRKKQYLAEDPSQSSEQEWTYSEEHQRYYWRFPDGNVVWSD